MGKELKDFDELNCPDCDTLCKPTKLMTNGTVVYEIHKCGLYFGVKTFDKSFKIDKNGDLITK